MTSSTVPAASSPEIEFWFEFGSNYSYLSVMRIENEARRVGAHIVWKPFLLGPIFRALGLENSPLVLHKEKGSYAQQDMTRLCEKYGLAPWVKPSVFPRLGVLPLRIVLVGADQPWIGAFCRNVMELNFVLDHEINNPEQMALILRRLDLPSTEILEQAQSEPIKMRLREQTDEARARGIFGAPTFFVGIDMFWGNDRLEDALLFASRGSRGPVIGRTIKPVSRK
jgi:2-hydroxychromene-2-carboxylate isomerase